MRIRTRHGQLYRLWLWRTRLSLNRCCCYGISWPSNFDLSRLCVIHKAYAWKGVTAAMENNNTGRHGGVACTTPTNQPTNQPITNTVHTCTATRSALSIWVFRLHRQTQLVHLTFVVAGASRFLFCLCVLRLFVCLFVCWLVGLFCWKFHGVIRSGCSQDGAADWLSCSS